MFECVCNTHAKGWAPGCCGSTLAERYREGPLGQLQWTALLVTAICSQWHRMSQSLQDLQPGLLKDRSKLVNWYCRRYRYKGVKLIYSRHHADLIGRRAVERLVQSPGSQKSRINQVRTTGGSQHLHPFKNKKLCSDFRYLTNTMQSFKEKKIHYR